MDSSDFGGILRNGFAAIAFGFWQNNLLAGIFMFFALTTLENKK